jgi:hypothetical protein
MVFCVTVTKDSIMLSTARVEDTSALKMEVVSFSEKLIMNNQVAMYRNVGISTNQPHELSNSAARQKISHILKKSKGLLLSSQ